MNVAASGDVVVAEIDAIWQGAFDSITRHTGRWRYGRRLTLSHADYIEPRAFCDSVLAEALQNRAFLKTNQRAAFFDWACRQPAIKAFLLVIAAHDLLSRGDRDRAIGHLDLALALDQEDLYAQELWFAARGEPIKSIDATKWMCSNPFTRIESASQNRLMFCCPAWLPAAAGSLDDDTVESVWNSSAAQDIRASIHDGSYRYCSRMHCPKLSENDLEPTSKISSPDLRDAWQSKATILSPKINRIALAHDRSCNISCPSCRTKLIIANKAETSRLDQLAEKSLLPLILASNRVSITGSGDPFSSKHYRNIIRRLTALQPGPIIDLQTNGLLLARSWDALGLEGRVGTVLLSIDAATKETYEIIRRGGIFEELKENLAFLSALRKRGGVSHVRLDFITQALNFREMPEAADMMRAYGFDKIKFQMLRSWGTWSTEEFKKQHVGHPGHPEYAELQKVMLDPRLNQPDVLLSGFYSITAHRSSPNAKSAPNSACSKGEARHVSSLA
jgi:pyruvate-formate lyase-activating enzyme